MYKFYRMFPLLRKIWSTQQGEDEEKRVLGLSFFFLIHTGCCKNWKVFLKEKVWGQSLEEEW